MLEMLQAAWKQYTDASAHPSDAGVQVNFVDRRIICGLHMEYFNDPSETDVITFPLRGPGLSGEIYVCVEAAIAQAERHEVAIDAELARLALHGVLHLLGFDDLQPKARRRMRQLERRFLKQFSFIANQTKAG